MVNEPTWEGILLDGVPVPIEYRGVAPWRMPEARGGTGILLRTNMGTIRCLLHLGRDAHSYRHFASTLDDNRFQEDCQQPGEALNARLEPRKAPPSSPT